MLHNTKSIIPTHRSITVGTGCFVISRGLHHELEQGVLGWEGSPFLHVCGNPVQDHKQDMIYTIQYINAHYNTVIVIVTKLITHIKLPIHKPEKKRKKKTILLNTSTVADQSYDLEYIYKPIREKDVITCG